MFGTSAPNSRRLRACGLAIIFNLLLPVQALGWTPFFTGQQSSLKSGAKTTTTPIGKAALLKAVKLAAESSNRRLRAEMMDVVIRQVATHGLDFQPTAEDEEELRKAGASAELLEAVRVKGKEQAEQIELAALREWKAIKESGRAKDFESYLGKYPTGEFAPLARDRAEQLTWETIKDGDKASDFNAYLAKYPTGKFSAQANERVEQLNWEAIKTSDKAAEFEAYLKKYPSGKFVVPARERVEQLDWEAIKASDKVADFEAYRRKYPTGGFASAAAERMEQLEWEAIKASDKAADFDAYLQKHPTGKFAGTARERKGQLTATTDTRTQKSATVTAPNDQTPAQVGSVTWTSEETLGHVISKVTPLYPRRAREMGIRGMVRVRVFVSETGMVTLAEAYSGPAALQDAAKQAALKWTFRPAQRAGSPVKAQGIIAFNFIP